MAKYTLVIEDVPGGAKLTVEGGDASCKPSEAREMVLAIITSSKALQLVGKALVCHPARPARRDLH
ncbi:MAG: hypothetical protein V7688_09360 [Alcanivorax jadensis]|jgi:hypothetical protein|uniref:hypothetical protein n=1 Tax=Alcanivorax jadensis TaxID=64988 RepID=UPI0030039540